ncbi:MAG: LLM class flavin-dependent oxidoreductase [Pseudonocardiaceae bacterium]
MFETTVRPRTPRRQWLPASSMSPTRFRSFGVDALSVLAVVGSQTSRVELGVGIVPTYPRHPLALAQQAATTPARPSTCGSTSPCSDRCSAKAA